MDKLTCHLTSYYRDALRWKRNEDQSDAESELDFGNMNMSSDDSPDDTELSSLADTAVTVMTALFCAQVECRSKDATAEFLNTAKSADDPIVISKLRGWTTDMLKRLSQDGSSSVTFEAESPDKLQKYVDPYTTTDYDDFPPDRGLKCHPWPIIANIVYHIDNPTLRMGNEMRDAPGTLDSNKAHADATTDSLRDADKIMIFADMTSRVASNESIEKLIQWAYRRRGTKAIWLVLTKCDVNVEKDDSIKFIAKERQMLQSIEQDLSKLKMKLMSTKQDLRSCLRGTLEERAELEETESFLK
jgi:GTPase SAR1 family protein